MFILLPILLLFHHLTPSLLVMSAPVQIPLRASSPSINSESSIITNTITDIAPTNNNVVTSSAATTISNPHTSAIYDICLSWKTLPKPGDYSCHRVRLDRAVEGRVTRRDVAEALGGSLPVTVVMALAADQGDSGVADVGG
jgi:hypothetical protein